MTISGEAFAKLRNGKPGATVREPLGGKHVLVATYDENGDIAELALSKDGNVKALRIYFDWVNDMHAFKTKQGLSGEQWCDGVVVTGTVYDDTGGSGGATIGLDEWVADCIRRMMG